MRALPDQWVPVLPPCRNAFRIPRGALSSCPRVPPGESPLFCLRRLRLCLRFKGPFFNHQFFSVTYDSE